MPHPDATRTGALLLASTEGPAPSSLVCVQVRTGQSISSSEVSAAAPLNRRPERKRVGAPGMRARAPDLFRVMWNRPGGDFG